MVFACLGVLKMPINIYLLCIVRAGESTVGGLKRSVFTKFTALLITYTCEDCIELFLEYFYIEKYIGSTPPYYMIGQDFVKLVLTLYMMYKYTSAAVQVVWKYIKDEVDKDDLIVNTFIFLTGVVIGVVSFLRVGHHLII